MEAISTSTFITPKLYHFKGFLTNQQKGVTAKDSISGVSLMNWILVEVENVSCRSSWVLLFFKKTIIFKCVRNLCCYKPVKPNKKCVFVKVLVWRRKLSNGQSMFAKQQNIFLLYYVFLICIPIFQMHNTFHSQQLLIKVFW